MPLSPTIAFAYCTSIEPVPPLPPLIRTLPPFFNRLRSRACKAVIPFPPSAAASASDILFGVQTSRCIGQGQNSARVPNPVFPRICIEVTPNTCVPSSSSGRILGTFEPTATTVPENSISGIAGILCNQAGSKGIIILTPGVIAQYAIFTRTSSNPKSEEDGATKSFVNLRTLAGVPRSLWYQARMIGEILLLCMKYVKISLAGAIKLPLKL